MQKIAVDTTNRVQSARRVYDPVFHFSEFERNIRMTKQERFYAAHEIANDMYNWLISRGAGCYKTSSCNRVLWIPWGSYQATDLNNPRAVAHALVMGGAMSSNVPMRVHAVDEFITICRRYEMAIRKAPEAAKTVVRALHLY